MDRARPDGSKIRARILGKTVSYSVASPGRHVARNSLAVLAGVAALGADLDAAATALSALKPPPGRGARAEIRLPADRSFSLTRATTQTPLPCAPRSPTWHCKHRRLGAASPRSATCWSWGPRHRNSTPRSPIHREQRHRPCVLSGPMMKHLYERLPAERRGAYAATSDALADEIAARAKPGDAIMVKGSLGSRMKTVVERLQNLNRQAPATGE